MQHTRQIRLLRFLKPGHWLIGLLMFTGADGHVEEAFTPKFNTLFILIRP